jgi:hypothetical protein
MTRNPVASLSTQASIEWAATLVEKSTAKNRVIAIEDQAGVHVDYDT